MLSHRSNSDQALRGFESAQASFQSDAFWAFQEFASADLGDLRLTHRLQLLASRFSQQPMASIPQACGDWADSKAAYRFCSNKKVSFDAILAPHFIRALERANSSQSSVILCPQDTTTLNYMAHPATEGLGHIGTKLGKSLGMLLHSTLAVSPQGELFGLLAGHCWARTLTRRPRQARSRYGMKIQAKESFRWLNGFRQVEQMARAFPERNWVSVSDREGDIFEVLQEATAPGHRAGLLTRARHDRSLMGQRGRTLFQHMRELPQSGVYNARLPREEGRPARDALLSVRFAPVTFGPPRYHETENPISLWAVWAQEIDPPAGENAICWCLLTTVAARTLTEAIERIAWYVRRWTIEEFHRTLKSGCRVEARQLTTQARLQRALAIDMVVAWRIMDLNKAARLEPNAPADRWLSRLQWQALYCYIHQTQQPPETAPTISQAVGWIAQLGGFLARKTDGPPGSMTVWRGLQRLNDIVLAWQAFGPASTAAIDAKSPRNKTAKRCG